MYRAVSQEIVPSSKLPLALLSLYKSAIETNIDKLVDILSPGTQVPYCKARIITEEDIEYTGVLYDILNDALMVE